MRSLDPVIVAAARMHPQVATIVCAILLAQHDACTLRARLASARGLRCPAWVPAASDRPMDCRLSGLLSEQAASLLIWVLQSIGGVEACRLCTYHAEDMGLACMSRSLAASRALMTRSSSCTCTMASRLASSPPKPTDTCARLVKSAARLALQGVDASSCDLLACKRCACWQSS